MPMIFTYKPDQEKINIILSCNDKKLKKYIQKLDEMINGFLIKPYKIYIGNIFLSHFKHCINKKFKSSKRSKSSKKSSQGQTDYFDGSSDLTQNFKNLTDLDYLIKFYAFKLLKIKLEDLQDEKYKLQLIKDQDPYILFEGTSKDFHKIHKEVKILEEDLRFKIFKIKDEPSIDTYQMYQNPDIIESALIESSKFQVKQLRINNIENTFDRKAYIVNKKLIFEIKLLVDEEDYHENLK